MEGPVFDLTEQEKELKNTSGEMYFVQMSIATNVHYLLYIESRCYHFYYHT